MRNKQKGFSLIELLIVVAIILIVAAIAIPNLLRSKMSANEASAVGSLRILNTASISFNTTYGNYPPALSDLGPSTVPPSTAADLIDSALVTGTKSGYTFSFTPNSTNTEYSINASPVTVNVTG
jgi:prepilin-type N-terminal cleavage/methylation domain-containing protein